MIYRKNEVEARDLRVTIVSNVRVRGSMVKGKNAEAWEVARLMLGIS